MKINSNAVSYGVLSGLGILLLFISIIAVFQGYGIAISEFKRLWYFIVPLAIGFGTQIGLYISIKRDASIKAGVKTSGAVSGSSMVICCSHYLLNIIPIISVTGLTTFLMTYQKAFFILGIISSIVGIAMMLNHKRKMKEGNCCK